MGHLRIGGIIVSLPLFLFVPTSHAQSDGGNVYWRIDPNVKSCSMVIDPSLTQDQWHTFVKQVGAISSFKSLASASTLGTGKFHVAVDYSSTPVDQRDLAWINTFTHPDENCPLGDAVVVPAIRAGMGIADHVDIGAYWTAAPNANYGMVGAEVKYAFLQESETFPAAAARASTTILTGVADFDLNIFSIDLLTSKKIAMFTPYIGVRTSLVVGTEKTAKVDLARENFQIAQGYAGAVYSVWMLNLAAEYNISSVSSFAFAIGLKI